MKTIARKFAKQIGLARRRRNNDAWIYCKEQESALRDAISQSAVRKVLVDEEYDFYVHVFADDSMIDDFGFTVSVPIEEYIANWRKTALVDENL